MNAETAEETTDDRTEEAGTEQESSDESPRRRRATSSGTTSSRATRPKQPRTRPTQAKSASSRVEGEQSTSARTSGSRISAVKAVKQALEQFNTVTGRTPESVVGTRWDEDHWIVRLEVVESRRIPDTADLLAEYEVELDGSGELVAYSRQDRYVRGRPSE